MQTSNKDVECIPSLGYMKYRLIVGWLCLSSGPKLTTVLKGLLEGVFCLPVVIDSVIAVAICYLLQLNRTSFHGYARPTLRSVNTRVIIRLFQDKQQDL